ncbi:MAG: hypothetical protein WAM82_01815 [Thermoanaerobaculia bacterium]
MSTKAQVVQAVIGIVVVLVLVVAAIGGADPQTGLGTATGTSNVQVIRVVKVLPNSDSAYSIEYSFYFPGRDFVHIKNLGIVPGRGRFHYITHERELDFRDVASDDILQRVPFSETVIAAGEPPSSVIPRESEFPPEFRSFPWSSASSLQERANTVLNKYFRYWPREFDKKIYLTTTFTPLELRKLPPEVLGQVSILLSFPYDTTDRGFSFHVQSIVREGRTHSDDLRQTKDATIIATANQLVDQLVNEIRSGLNR